MLGIESHRPEGKLISVVTRASDTGMFDETAARAHLQFWCSRASDRSVFAMAFARWNPADQRFRQFRQRYFTPDQVENALRHAEDAVWRREDVFQAPHPRVARQRRKDTGEECGHTLWGDLDESAHDWSVPVLQDAGAAIADSGSPGHYHLYLLLDEPVRRMEIEELNRRLAEVLGGDHKWSNESLLRLAGTRNFKSGGEGRPVRWLVPPEEAKRLRLDEVIGLLECCDNRGRGASSRKPVGSDNSAGVGARTGAVDRDRSRSGRAWARIMSLLEDGADTDGIVAWFTGTDEGGDLMGTYGNDERRLRDDIGRARGRGGATKDRRYYGDEDPERLSPTDLGNALRLRDRYGDRYCQTK